MDDTFDCTEEEFALLDPDELSEIRNTMNSPIGPKIDRKVICHLVRFLIEVRKKDPKMTLCCMFKHIDDGDIHMQWHPLCCYFDIQRSEFVFYDILATQYGSCKTMKEAVNIATHLGSIVLSEKVTYRRVQCSPRRS